MNFKRRLSIIYGLRQITQFESNLPSNSIVFIFLVSGDFTFSTFQITTIIFFLNEVLLSFLFEDLLRPGPN